MGAGGSVDGSDEAAADSPRGSSYRAGEESSGGGPADLRSPPALRWGLRVAQLHSQVHCRLYPLDPVKLHALLAGPVAPGRQAGQAL